MSNQERSSAQADGANGSDLRSPTDKADGADRSRQQALLERQRRDADRLKSGTAAALWSRLNAVDFMNSAT